jgi:hypothetical protein
LACYDSLPIATGAAGAGAPAAAGAVPAGAARLPAVPAPEARFGLEQQVPAAQLDVIESHIPGLFEGWGPNHRIGLANGQVWQIADDSSRYFQRRDPKVAVRRGALGAFYLDIEGDNRSPRVRRVR